MSDPADGGTADGGTADGATEEAGGLDRRTLIRLLVGLGFGIPIAIELGTLVGLLGGSETRTVDLGDELLRETPQRETVVGSSIHVRDTWVFEYVVEVENTADAPYSLTLGPVYTEDGRTVRGTSSVEAVAPGESTTLRARWDVPASATVTALDAVATWGDRRVARRVSITSPTVYYE